MSSLLWIEIGIALAFVFGLFLSLEIGYRVGLRAGVRAADKSQIGIVQGAALGLLALLLGFSYAGAAQRLIGRQDLIINEANAVGTVYLRAELLEEPHRSDLRAVVREYGTTRVDYYDALDPDRFAAECTRSEDMLNRMWAAAREGVARNPALMMPVLPPVNDVIDLHATKTAALRRHMPGLVLAFLLTSAAISMILAGFGCGYESKRQHTIMISFALLIAIALWINFDLDYPRIGLIRTDLTPLSDLARTLRADAPVVK